MDRPTKSKILVTGGCGKIGSYFAKFAADKYSIRIVDKEAWDIQKNGPPPGESLVVDLQDPAACRKACEGMDMVIHLAADASPEADFKESLLENNIIATHNVFRAAKDAGCRRIIFASSVHAVAGYPGDVQIHSQMPVRPPNMYGVSKCFGEALAAYFAFTEGLPAIALRIGAYLFPQEYDHDSIGLLDAFLDPDDFNQLLVKCLETPGITYIIAHVISNNRFKRLDITETKEVLGYDPKADAFEIFGVFPRNE